MRTHIELYGCREGNLQGIDVQIPYGKLIVITGVSGSGKSSLAFRTIFAEGRRRIIESLAPKESYFLSNTCAPKIDLAIGLPPAIAIRQTQYVRSPKSTLGSISHINPFIFLLFATCGDIPCEVCASKNQVCLNPPQVGKCRKCGETLLPLEPGAFSNMSPVGMCHKCGGTGLIQDVDETLIYPDQTLSINRGGLKFGGPTKGTMKENFFKNFLAQFGADLDTPIGELSQEAKVALLYGVKKGRKYRVEFPGIVPQIMKYLKETRSELTRSQLEKFVVETTCDECGGYGINTRASAVTIGGKNIHEMLSLEVTALEKKLRDLKFGDVRDQIAKVALRKVLETARTMVELGIGYLALSRKTASLSGGEMHRARMAAQLASEITGVVYVLDEPSAGLHACEIDRLVSTMKRLRDLGAGNTIVAVEHDADIIRCADYIIELGPGPSRYGGKVVCTGSPEDLCACSESVTGKLLKSGHQAVVRERRQVTQKKLGIRRAQSNNLKNVDVDIPLNCLVAVTGISGSGKSSLVFDSLWGAGNTKSSSTRKMHPCELVGRDNVGDIVMSDQSPIGRSSHSVVGTYSGVLTLARNEFAKTKKAQQLGLDQGHFSFNTRRGCCSMCGGYGTIETDYPMLGGAEFTCPECGGRRFSPEVLSVRYRGASMADILDMDIWEAISLFGDVPSITKKLEVLRDVGLGYLLLGQSNLDISGGEAQRLKLAVDLMKGKRGNVLYVFDEPTAGLHATDINVLLSVFDSLLESGNSIIVVEHNLHLVWSCDYVIEMGPGAGDEGGEVVAMGTPVEMMDKDTSTGRALRKFVFCQ